MQTQTSLAIVVASLFHEAVDYLGSSNSEDELQQSGRLLCRLRQSLGTCPSILLLGVESVLDAKRMRRTAALTVLSSFFSEKRVPWSALAIAQQSTVNLFELNLEVRVQVLIA